MARCIASSQSGRWPRRDARRRTSPRQERTSSRARHRQGRLSTGYSQLQQRRRVLGRRERSRRRPRRPPVVAMSATPTSGTVALPVSFNASGTYDPDGSVVSIEWNFGDGSPLAYGTTASRTYTTPGSYTATVKVTDNAGLTSIKSVTITALAGTTSQPPVAVVSATPTSGPWRCRSASRRTVPMIRTAMSRPTCGTSAMAIRRPERT